MDGAEGAVLDVDVEVGAEDIEGGAGTGEGAAGAEGGEDEGQKQRLSPEEQQRKESRDYSKFLKSLKETNPENKRFINRAQDDHSRLYALQQLEPRGIDGVREKYALIESVQFNDMQGPEAISALQDHARETEQVDQMLAEGDERVWEMFGEEFNAGLAKLAPSLLNRIAEADPEAYSAAILPHFVEALKGSELVQSYNALVDVLSEAPPSYLNPEQKQAFAQEQMRKVMGLAGKMGTWLNAQAEAAKGKGVTPNGAKQQGGQQQRKDPAQDRLAEAERKEQDFHWKTNIAPQTDKHATSKFDELFRPYDKRLRLDATAKGALRQAFVQGVIAKSTAKVNGQDNPYMRQMARYRQSRNPDPANVVNYFKVEFDRHARGVLDGLVKERYGRFLSGAKQQATTTQSAGANKGAAKGPVGPNVIISTVKPKNIDFKNTPLDWLHQRKYRTTDGKIVQVRG